MLSYTDLKPGTEIILDGEPYVVLEYNFLRKQQRKPTVQTKIKSLISGKVVERTFQPSDTVEEAEIEKKEVKFLYSYRQEFWFCEPNNPGARFKLDESVMGTGSQFLKSNSIVTAHYFDGKIITISLPIKIDLKVTEAAPAVRGNTAQNVTKTVKVETGAVLSVPLFINQDDIIRINTETGQYVERVEKAKE